jgi:hypothetical protein
MLVSGYSILGVSWLLIGVPVGASLVGNDEGLGWTWFLPVVGPAIYSFMLFGKSDEDLGGLYVLGGVACWFVTLMQGTGLGLIVGGHVRAARARRAMRSQAADGQRFQLSVAPAGPGGSLGATLGARF